MPKSIEEVKEGLKQCAAIDRETCEGCPYKACGDSPCDCITMMINDSLAMLNEQEKRINELEEKLRLLEYGDQDILESGLRPAT